MRRTRKRLHTAFLELVVEQGYDKTTIQDILDRADVGRSTFYVHFRDKEALLAASFDDMRDQLEDALAAIPQSRDIDVTMPATSLFEHAFRHQPIYRALCGRHGGDVVQRHLRHLIGDVLRKHLRPQMTSADPAVPADVAAEFHTSATLGLLSWWIEHDFCNGPQWLAATYRSLAVP
ncbi:TetR family transcriptional regulator [Mycolicibacterium aubagnense]|uniref:TetR family transcriptional regulator n=1 Tax=Mycolicibacterium aubagnense TaxID=319707 RepID=A0ABM7I829_9MYCO|nr:TetR family transcriptional regulator [Mycolicibacterium aubagnense]